MKVSDIITRVRNTAGDTQVLQFTDAMLVDWINDGIRECAIANNLLQKRATSNTVSGTGQYALPADILKLHSVKVDGNKIDMQTLQEWEELNADGDSSTVTGDPAVGYIWAGQLNLYPAPNRVMVLTIDYIYDPAVIAYDPANPNVALAVVPAIPISYHPRLVDYCLAQVAQQDDDFNRYQVKMQEFLTGVSQLKDQAEYEQDVYPSITISPRDQDWTDW